MRKAESFSFFENALTEYGDKKVFLFDLDGTLINSEPLHVQAVVYTLVEVDGTVDISDLMKLQAEGINDNVVGMSDSEVYELISKKLGVTYQHTIEELVALKTEFLQSLEVEKLMKSPQCFSPEVLSFLKTLKKSGKRVGLVSASQKGFVDHAVAALNLGDFFGFVIGREDTKETKPDPSPYLFAIEQFKVDKSECLIFEDSQTGLASAKASGIDTVHVSWYSK